ncbi:MAG: FG-GAP-like repeat-containing protein [Gemmataceae bacterium]|nr:FG-GAP-like repeat-containing protein [Gemmataceae bacterium]
MSTPAPAPRRGRMVVPVVVGLLVVIGVAVWLLFLKKPPPTPDTPPDRAAAVVANTRGVALMEKFDFPAAAKEFEEAARLDPDWLPARVNLGMALFNQQSPETKELAGSVVRAQGLFRDILAKDPDNRHAHYCQGIISYYVGDLPPAYEHFVAVNKLDPDDAQTWMRVGSCHPDGTASDAARACFEKALALDPYLNEARYRLAQAQPLTDAGEKRKTELLEEFQRFQDSDFFTESKIEYSTMGKYAEVIRRYPGADPQPVGPLPAFAPADAKVTLAPGAKWATAADLDPLRKAARDRFGGTVVLFDYNHDGKPDVLLLSAVVQDGKVRDLLLRNDGGNAFTDVTAAAGLATPRPSLGAAAGDFDNDGHPDLVVTGTGEQHLFRNKGDGTFEDVSAAAGLDKLTGVYLGCGWADLDPDLDLDLILCRYADTPAAANNFAGTATGGGIDVFENVGVALPGKAQDKYPPLTTAFRRGDGLSKAVGEAAGPGPFVAFVAGDLDGDGDLDLLALPDGADPRLLVNDRLGRFRKYVPALLPPKGAVRWSGGLVLAASHADRSDVFLARSDGPSILGLAARRDVDGWGPRIEGFTPGRVDGPPLRQAVTTDLDLDGWADVVGLAAGGKPVLLHNGGDKRLAEAKGAFGEVGPALAVAVADLDGDALPDLLVWSDTGLAVRKNGGNGNAALAVDPSGRRNKGPEMRSNGDGIGAWVVAQTGPHWAGVERTTLSAGLGQSLVPLTLGLGKHKAADALLARWPDLVVQGEAGVPTGAVYKLVENNRKTTSCPVLLTWDGEKFVFVTDFLGVGALGETGPDGSIRPPRGEESVKIEARQLRPKDGRYVLKIAEPMDEVMYPDHLRLDVIDHPAGVAVYPDERFVFAEPPPTQELQAFRTRHHPKRAIDHRGQDVTERVLTRDNRAVDGFARRAWLGYAEDHAVTLEFGEVPGLGGDGWCLVLAGWTEYPYPESMYAATRAGVPLAGPVVERLAADGVTWEPVCDLGFPAGLPRVMTRKLPTLKPGPCTLRIRTNMQVFWDEIVLARAEPAEGVGRVTPLGVTEATLAHRGFMKEVRPPAGTPVGYDDSATEPVAVTKWKGWLTRLGDVTPLLAAADDRLVLCGPGDEVTVGFDAQALPPLPAGWERTFVLRTFGYCKDTSPTTVTGGDVWPLPFRAMGNYPPDFDKVKRPKTHSGDCDEWHTRPASGK